MWKSCGQHPYWWSALLLFITLAPFKYVYTGNLSLRLKNVTHLRTSVLETALKTKRSIVNLLSVQPTPFAIYRRYVEYLLYVRVHDCLLVRVCVLHKDTWLRPLLFLPPTSHTQSVNSSCCLMSKEPTTHSHTNAHLHTRLKQT